jgi:hypothetical protein
MPACRTRRAKVVVGKEIAACIALCCAGRWKFMTPSGSSISTRLRLQHLRKWGEVLVCDVQMNTSCFGSSHHRVTANDEQTSPTAWHTMVKRCKPTSLRGWLRPQSAFRSNHVCALCKFEIAQHAAKTDGFHCLASRMSFSDHCGADTAHLPG